MAEPTFVAIGSTINGTASTMSVDVPAGVVAGSGVVVVAFLEGTTTITGMPTGFANATNSPVAVNTGNTGAHRLYVMWKRATGSDADASTYDFTLSGSGYRQAAALLFANMVATGDPWADFASAAESGNTNVTATPNVSGTSLGVDRLLVWAATVYNGSGFTPPSSPGAFTTRWATGDLVATAATLSWSTAASTGSVSGTVGVASKVGAWLGALIGTTAGGTNATVNASTIAAVAAFPAASKSTGSRVSPNAIAAVAALPAPSKSTGSTVAPAVVAAVAAVAAVAVRTGSTVSPAAVAATAAFSAASVQAGGGATVTPSTIAAVAALPGAALSAGSTVSPAAIASMAALPAAVASGGATATPGTVAAVAALRAAVVSTGVVLVYTRLGGQLLPVSLSGAVRVGGASVAFG